jgi:saccharopine dehydrogenase-like NADP-dependent oxidoreductase
MKIIVFGGAGDMGSRTVEDLVQQEDVTHLTIGDRDVVAAERVARSVRGKGAEVEVKRVDANEHGELVQAMRGHDVVASALGPFSRFESRMVRAALEADVDYASICDEWDAAEAVLDEFDEPARKAGRIIITGLGASPGVSNLGVRLLAESMERVRKVDIAVYQPLNAGGGEAVLRHVLFIITGKLATWRGGKRVVVPACGEERFVTFPTFGRIKLWNMGHSEPVTLPRYIQGLEEVNFFMGFGGGAGLFIAPARWGLFKSQLCVDAVVKIVGPIERMTAGGKPGLGALRMDVHGESGGKEVHRMLCGVGQMREVTGISLALGTLMLARRKLLTEKGGVYPPEGCLDHKTFITEMRSKGLEAFEDIEMTKPLA